MGYLMMFFVFGLVLAVSSDRIVQQSPSNKVICYNSTTNSYEISDICVLNVRLNRDGCDLEARDYWGRESGDGTSFVYPVRGNYVRNILGKTATQVYQILCIDDFCHTNSTIMKNLWINQESFGFDNELFPVSKECFDKMTAMLVKDVEEKALSLAVRDVTPGLE